MLVAAIAQFFSLMFDAFFPLIYSLPGSVFFSCSSFLFFVIWCSFCWGARFSVLASGSSLKSGKAMFDCFAVAHPTRVAVPADIEALTVSGIFLCAEKDNAFTPENVEQSKKVTKDLSEKNPSLSYVFEHYPGTEHGFAVRGGDETLEQRNAAFKAASGFFKKHLA
jgi:dienelactone hydrolase